MKTKPDMKNDDLIEKALNDADDDCESANYHDRVGLAGEIYKSIKNLVPPERRVKLARKIAEAVCP